MNDKIKALFFSQYYGQKIHKHVDSTDTFMVSTSYYSEGWYLSLRTVDQLTDEEKINIAKIVCARHNRHYKAEEISYIISKKRNLNIEVLVKGAPRYIVEITNDGIGFTTYWMGGAGKEHYYCPGQYSTTQIMIAYGILLSFTHLNDENKPITLSTDEIISLGWAKIKEE